MTRWTLTHVALGCCEPARAIVARTLVRRPDLERHRDSSPCCALSTRVRRTIDVFSVRTIALVACLVHCANLRPRRSIVAAADRRSPSSPRTTSLRADPALRYPALALAVTVSAAIGTASSWRGSWIAREASAAASFEPRASRWHAWTTSCGLASLRPAVCAVRRRLRLLPRRRRKRRPRGGDAERDRARFVQQMDEARLQMLQAQIEPHFLFNTLANVRRLYQTDAARARVDARQPDALSRGRAAADARRRFDARPRGGAHRVLPRHPADPDGPTARLRDRHSDVAARRASAADDAADARRERDQARPWSAARGRVRPRSAPASRTASFDCRSPIRDRASPRPRAAGPASPTSAPALPPCTARRAA